MPALHIISGSNGAGKSSIGTNYLPELIQTTCSVFDGDKLFMQKKKALWDSGNKATKEIKKIAFAEVSEVFDKLVDDAINQQANFAYEGHFTNEATWDIPRKFKAAGYSIHMLFLGLMNTDLSYLRVVNRAKEGGHYVDPTHLSANFYGNLEKLNLHFDMFDTLQIVDTSETTPKVLCLLENNQIVSCVRISVLPEWFTTYLPRLIEKIKISS